ncbi:MAG: phosphonate ABC transporter ATP-binding protein [Anaerolineae bacterium]|nr:phosphonate ABC transporter ATP-binding protein [Anaerolineae bacterium]
MLSSRLCCDLPACRHGHAGLPEGRVRLLRVESLTKVFPDGTVALKNVTFEVQDGEFLAVIGLSGSGKSTLLRCINRLIDPTGGRVLWNGVDTTAAQGAELRHIRRQIGMIFQQFNLVKRSSVLTNVLSGRLGYAHSWWSLVHRFSPDDRQRAVAALERVGISEKADNRADQLSGGQQQRVGIARALMQEPQLLLADEPVASLDPVLAHSILQYLELLNRQDEITVLCSLHFLDLVHRYASRVVGLKDGELVFDGLPSELTRERFKEVYGEEAEMVTVGGMGQLAEG